MDSECGSRTNYKLSLVHPRHPRLFVDFDVVHPWKEGWAITNANADPRRVFRYRFSHGVFAETRLGRFSDGDGGADAGGSGRIPHRRVRRLAGARATDSLPLRSARSRTGTGLGPAGGVRSSGICPAVPSLSYSSMTALGLTALGVLLGGWILYPAVLWLVAQVRRRASAVSVAGVPPTVEVIVATRDAPDAVRTRVRNLLASDYPDRLGVTVAVDASAADRLEAIREAVGAMPGVQVVLGDPPGGKAAALNAGVRAARAGVLAFTDTAQTFESGTLGCWSPALTKQGSPGVWVPRRGGGSWRTGTFLVI